MFKRILIAYDGSEHAQRAAELAGEMARLQKKPELWLICAMDPIPIELGNPYIAGLTAEYTRISQEFLKQAKGLIGKGVDVHEETLFGSPAESILEASKKHECDLIIMGTRGLGGLKGLLLGSQIQKVISVSPVPVLAVK
jgi:nucleotide-binding universal stress UspA family protein